MSSLGVLGDRQFRRYFVGQATSYLGDGLLPVAVSFAVLDLTGSATDLGVVLAARMVPVVLFLLVGGVWADRLPRHLVMLGSDIGRGAVQALLAVLLLTGNAQLWHLLVLQALYGAAEAFMRPASTGLLPTIIPANRLQQANALMAMTVNGAYIVGPAAAGILVAAAGAGTAIAIDAATFAVSTASLALLRVPPAAERAARLPFLADLRDGWRAFTAIRWVWTVVGSITISSIFWGAWSALGPVVADRELGGAEAWGIVLGAVGAGGLLGGLGAIRARPHRPLVVAAVGFTLFSVPLGALAAGASVPVLAAAAFVSGVSLMVGNSLWESTLQRHVPPESLSRVSAFDWFGSMALYPLGLAIWGPVSVALGLHETLWLAFALLVATTMPLLAIKDVRELREG
jgi:MFS family permease